MTAEGETMTGEPSAPGPLCDNCHELIPASANFCGARFS